MERGRERLGVEFIAKPLVVIGLIGAALAVDTGDGVVRGLSSLRSARRWSAMWC